MSFATLFIGNEPSAPKSFAYIEWSLGVFVLTK